MMWTYGIRFINVAFNKREEYAKPEDCKASLGTVIPNSSKPVVLMEYFLLYSNTILISQTFERPPCTKEVLPPTVCWEKFHQLRMNSDPRLKYNLGKLHIGVQEVNPSLSGRECAVRVSVFWRTGQMWLVITPLPGLLPGADSVKVHRTGAVIPEGQMIWKTAV